MNELELKGLKAEILTEFQETLNNLLEQCDNADMSSVLADTELDKAMMDGKSWAYADSRNALITLRDKVEELLDEI